MDVDVSTIAVSIDALASNLGFVAILRVHFVRPPWFARQNDGKTVALEHERLGHDKGPHLGTQYVRRVAQHE